MRTNEFKMPRAGQLWKNHKGTLYIIDHIGTATETGEPDVAYFAADQFEDYRRDGPGGVEWFHRPLSIFLGTTKTPAGAYVRRFLLEPDHGKPPTAPRLSLQD